MKNKLPLKILCTLPAFLLLAGFFSCKPDKNGNNAGKDVIPVKTHTVKNRTILYPIRCSGMVSSQLESKFSFKTGGVIDKIYIDEGQKVKKGTLLAKLHLTEIEANVTMASSAFNKAQRDFERVQNLYKDSVTTLEQLQNTKTAMEVARSNYEIAKFNRKYSIIKAPSHGKILKILAEENEVIGAGHPVVLFASTEHSWIVRTSVADKDIIHLKIGDTANISLDAYPGQQFTSHVSEIGTMADPYTGTYEVELTMAKNYEKMASGFVAKIDIYPSFTRKLPVVPMNALIESNEMTGYVYVLQDSTSVRTKILIDKITDEGLAVKAGIEEGAVVITEGLHYITNGTKIKIVN